MNRKDYDKFYLKGGTYIMPTEIFNELFNEYEYFRDDRNNLIKYLEDKIKHYSNLDSVNCNIRVDVYTDLLEKVKNNNYD